MEAGASGVQDKAWLHATLSQKNKTKTDHNEKKHNAPCTWTRIHLFGTWTLFTLDMYPGVAQLDQVIVLLYFEKPSYHFSKMTVGIYIPSNSVQGFLFLYDLANTSYLSPLIPAGVR